MAFQTTPSAAVYSAVVFSVDPAPTTIPSTQAEWAALFATEADYAQLTHIREMPPLGQRANTIRVPEFGHSQSLSVAGQSDAPDMSFTLNYVASDWAPGTPLADALDDKEPRVFQFSLLSAKPTDLTATAIGLGSRSNTNLYAIASIDSMEIQPSLTDATTAVVTLSLKSSFAGPFTYGP